MFTQGLTLHFELKTLARPWALTTSPLLPALHVPACTHNGKTYSHGEVWNPTVLSFGPMPCILCTCMDGYQDCHRVTCPTQYPCSQPKKVAGKCCKICPGKRARKAPTGTGRLGDPHSAYTWPQMWGLKVPAGSMDIENTRLHGTT